MVAIGCKLAMTIRIVGCKSVLVVYNVVWVSFLECNIGSGFDDEPVILVGFL